MSAIAIGISSIKRGAVGDGVPGTGLTALPLPTKGSVVFNFSDPKEVKLDIEGSVDPLYSFFTKDATDYIEFSIQSPDNAIVKTLAGGTVDTTDGKDIWKEPTSVPDINETYVLETEVHNGHKVVYTIVNGKVMAKFSQAPSSDKSDIILVRVYKNAAISAAGVRGYAFSREVVAVPAE